MGLTIHYELTVPNKWSIETVRKKLESLRQACMDLPVVGVSDLREFKGDECKLSEAKDEPFRWTLLEGAKGVQLAEKGIESWQKRQWVAVPDLEE